MANPSKRKGNRLERELVHQARERGLAADRAYASNGLSLGEAEEVDIVINGMRLQAKRRKKFPAYLKLGEGVDGVVFRADRGPAYVLIRWKDLLDKLEEGW